MDTTEVAAQLGTTARQLRVFLRSTHSTFVPVGSGARYEFTDREIPTLKKRFTEWQRAGKPRPVTPPKPEVKSRTPKVSERERRDQRVWSEEGEVKIPDIRDPKVRARALADARAAEERLMLRLMAVGLHITQLGDKR
jgi:hypothetical protein